MVTRSPPPPATCRWNWPNWPYPRGKVRAGGGVTCGRAPWTDVSRREGAGLGMLRPTQTSRLCAAGQGTARESASGWSGRTRACQARAREVGWTDATGARGRRVRGCVLAPHSNVTWLEPLAGYDTAGESATGWTWAGLGPIARPVSCGAAGVTSALHCRAPARPSLLTPYGPGPAVERGPAPQRRQTWEDGRLKPTNSKIMVLFERQFSANFCFIPCRE